MEKDLLGHLLNFKDEKGQTLTEDKIADNIIGVLFAAQDTTASVITWILKFLRDDPRLLEAVKVIIEFQFRNLPASSEFCHQINRIVSIHDSHNHYRQSKRRYTTRTMEERGP